MRHGAVLVLAATLILAGIPSTAQEPVSKRTILDHAAPSYPALARRMGVSGIVKMDVVVTADGTVRTVEIRGGHPVLVQAATNAVRQWRWERSDQKSHEQVQVKFSPTD